MKNWSRLVRLVFYILAAFIKKDVKAVDGFAISQRSASAGIIIYFSSLFVGSVVGEQTRIFAGTRDDATCPPLPSIPRLRLCIVRIHSHYSFFRLRAPHRDAPLFVCCMRKNSKHFFSLLFCYFVRSFVTLCMRPTTVMNNEKIFIHRMALCSCRLLIFFPLFEGSY